MAASISKTLTRCSVRSGGRLSSLPRHWVPQSSSSSFSTSASAVSSVPETPSTSASQPQDKERVSRWSKWLLFLPGAITFGLGTWQIFRRQEKIKTLDYRQRRLEMEPMQFNSTFLSSESLDSLEFRRLVLKGIFDEGKSIYVGPRSRSISGVIENGYYVITPLMPIPNNPESVQSPVLINRGWIPRSLRDKPQEVSAGAEPSNKAPFSVAQSERSPWWKFWSKKPEIVEDKVHVVAPVEVVGVIRASEKPSIFVPANDPNSCQWFYVDVPAIACASGLPGDTIYIEDINENVNPSNPYPVPKDVNTLLCSSVMPQDHLNYTLTWYSLSAAVTFMAFKRLRPKKSRR